MLKVIWGNPYGDGHVESFKEAIKQRCDQLLALPQYENIENVRRMLDNEIGNLKRIRETLYEEPDGGGCDDLCEGYTEDSVAKCPKCGGEIDKTTGFAGEPVEYCTNKKCGHVIEMDLEELKHFCE